MYLVTIRNGSESAVIHDPFDSEVKIASAKVTREVNAIDSLTFDIYPDNPGFDLITPFATTIEVVGIRNGKTVFEGRVIQPVPSMDSDGAVMKSVTCEGPMGYLCDSTQKYYEESHFDGDGSINGLQEYIDMLLGRHNEAVEAHKRIYRGDVTLKTFDTSEGVTKSVSRGSTWDNLNDKLIKSFGGEMRVRRGDDGLLYLDYAEKLGTTRATVIELGRNMQEIEQEIDPSAVITRLYPYGAKITVEETDENGNATEVETEERVTIESVNEGRTYIDDAVAIEQYGIIEGYQEFDDITEPNNLLARGKEWLGDNNAMPTSHSITALDLSLLGLDVDSFEIFDSYPCRNPLIGVDEILEIVKQTIDLNEPENSSFEMGETSYRLSADISGTTDVGGRLDVFEDQTSTNITNIFNTIKTTAASIKVAEDRILSTVSENVQEVNESLQTINEQVTQLIQTSTGWEFNFETIEQQITDLGTTYSEQLKYIKFIDGEIWLGEDTPAGEDDFKIVVGNERIRFLQNNVEVAYISGNKLYITNAQILDNLQLGNFAFYPRAGGNLTFRYIG